MKRIILLFPLLILILTIAGCKKNINPNDNPDITEEYTEGKATLVSTYKENRYVAAQYFVTNYGAKGDGRADDTTAIQQAIDKAAENGGGTVYIPKGRYKITRQITIWDNVTLLGFFTPPTMKGSAAEEGTILVCEENSNTLANPMMVLRDNAAISDLTIWYEGQQYNDIKEYPYTIQQTAGETASVTNVALLNSWNGIMFDSNNGKRLTVENVYITAFGTGFNIRQSSDRVILRNINLSPIYWINSSLTEQKKDFSYTYITNVMTENLCAVKIGLVSDASIYGVNVDTAKSGIEFSIPTSINGSAVISKTNVSNAKKCVTVNSAGQYGIAFAGCSFRTDDSIDSTAVYFGKDFTTSAVFNSCSFLGQPYKEAETDGRGRISFVNCYFTAWRSYALSVNDGVTTSFSNTYSSTNPIGIFNNKSVGNFVDDIYYEENYAEGNTFFTKTETECKDTELDTNWLNITDKIPKVSNNIIYAHSHGITPENENLTKDLQYLINKTYISGGGIIFLDEGIYRLQSQIILKKGVRLCGLSPEKTVLTAEYGIADSIILADDGSSIFDLSITFDSLPVFSDEVIPEGFAISTYPKTKNLYIENVNLGAVPNGIFLNNTSTVTIKKIHGTAYGKGIVAEKCDTLLLDANTFDTEYGAEENKNYQEEHFTGFSFSDGKDISVINCYVDSADYGVLINSGDEVSTGTPMIIVNSLLSKHCYSGFCIEKSTMSVFVNTIAYCTVFDKNAFHCSVLTNSSGDVYVFNMLCGGKATSSVILRGSCSLYAQSCVFNGELTNAIRMLDGEIQLLGCIFASNPNEYHISADNGTAILVGNLINTSMTYDGMTTKYLRKDVEKKVVFVEDANIKEYDATEEED